MEELIKPQFDDEVKSLIIEALASNKTGGGDIDSLIRLKEEFVVIEFLRCITARPFDSHPNRYWDYVPDKIGNKNKFIALWNIAQKTKSKLMLINYEDSREQFKIIEVRGLSDSRKIYDEVVTKMNFDEFKKWFNDLVDKSY
jgi:hypothetical protein